MTGRKTSDGFLCFSLLYKEIMTAPLFLSSGVSIHFWISLSHLLSLLRIWRMACCCITIILRLTTHTCYQFLWIRGTRQFAWASARLKSRCQQRMQSLLRLYLWRRICFYTPKVLAAMSFFWSVRLGASFFLHL